MKQHILDYARSHEQIGVSQLVSDLGINFNTARQYLSSLTKDNMIARIGNGEYKLADKQVFRFIPSETLAVLYHELKDKFPFADFCIYDGSIFNTLQQHVSINHAIYVETNRDAVDSVFSRLKETHAKVYKQPDAKFVYDYVNLQEQCIIVKTFVTESPINRVDDMIVPALEKLLVDIQRDKDFDYMQGLELTYIFEAAYNLYSVNTPKMLRYARRRNTYNSTFSLIEQAGKHIA